MGLELREWFVETSKKCILTIALSFRGCYCWESSHHSGKLICIWPPERCITSHQHISVWKRFSSSKEVHLASSDSSWLRKLLQSRVKSLTLATETTFVHFRQHNAPYCNWGPPQNVHSVVLMNIRHCYTYQDSRALVQIVQMHHILERKKKEQNEGDQDVQWKLFVVDTCILLHIHCKLFLSDPYIVRSDTSADHLIHSRWRCMILWLTKRYCFLWQ